MSVVSIPLSVIAMIAAPLSAYGLICACHDLAELWRRATRGEFHCDKCGQVKALPKDDDR